MKQGLAIGDIKVSGRLQQKRLVSGIETCHNKNRSILGYNWRCEIVHEDENHRWWDLAIRDLEEEQTEPNRIDCYSWKSQQESNSELGSTPIWTVR